MRSTNHCIGHLRDDLDTLASQVQQSLADGNQTVWAEDDGRVYSCPMENDPDLPTHWIAGTFGLGQPLEEIADDLRALLRERSKDWIID